MQAVPVEIDRRCAIAARMPDSDVAKEIESIVRDCSTPSFQYSYENVRSKVLAERQFLRDPIRLKSVKVGSAPKPRETVGLATRCMADIESRPIEWLWKNRIPTKLNLIAGPPGQGKSQITISFAAIVSSGGKFPDGADCDQGSVIFISGEDDAADTIKPRLQAAGADLSRVHIVDAIEDSDGNVQSWSVGEGMSQLAGLMDDLGDVRLIIIDPITAYLGSTDSHKNADVRSALEPLTVLADEYKAAVMMVSHLNKAKGMDAMDRVTGSGAFVAITRMAFMVGKHPDIEDAMCLAVAKTNISKDKTAIGYQIIDCKAPGGIETSRVKWLDTVDIDANELLAPQQKDVSGAFADACDFLEDALADGPKPASKVFEVAETHGIKERTLRKAKSELKVTSKREDGRFVWELPARAKAAT